MSPMVNSDTAYFSLYKQALEDPSQLSEEDLLNIIVRYPYSQPLLFAYERRKKLLHEDSPNKELALLYAPNSSWLCDFVNKPVEFIEELTPEQDGYIPYVELNKVEEEQISILDTTNDDGLDLHESNAVVESAVLQEDAPKENSIPIINFDFDNVSSHHQSEEMLSEEQASIMHNEQTNAEDEHADELDVMLQSVGISGDYFLFDRKSKEEDSQEIIEQEPEGQFEDEGKAERDNISLYNDDLMPYSFRWWLHKTRLEYADTYQPFAMSYAPFRDIAPVYLNEAEKTVLDQQIKENIIHLQDPESKLSEEVLKREIEPAIPKKSDPIIERFIKEEPIIQPPAPANLNNENMARQSAEDNYVLVTETLAKIYEDQGLFLKSIEVFKKLILKYPEKKSYFVHRIQELEKNV